MRPFSYGYPQSYLALLHVRFSANTAELHAYQRIALMLHVLRFKSLRIPHCESRLPVGVSIAGLDVQWYLILFPTSVAFDLTTPSFFKVN